MEKYVIIICKNLFREQLSNYKKAKDVLEYV